MEKIDLTQWPLTAERHESFEDSTINDKWRWDYVILTKQQYELAAKIIHKTMTLEKL